MNANPSPFKFALITWVQFANYLLHAIRKICNLLRNLRVKLFFDVCFGHGTNNLVHDFSIFKN